MSKIKEQFLRTSRRMMKGGSTVAGRGWKFIKLPRKSDLSDFLANLTQRQSVNLLVAPVITS